MVTERTSILIIRAWSSDHPTAPLRVRIRHTSAVGVETWRTLVLSDADAVTQFVQTWLAEIGREPVVPVVPV